MRASTRERRSKRSQPPRRQTPTARQQSADMSRLAARVAQLEELLGLAEEPVRVIRIG